MSRSWLLCLVAAAGCGTAAAATALRSELVQGRPLTVPPSTPSAEVIFRGPATLAVVQGASVRAVLIFPAEGTTTMTLPVAPLTTGAKDDVVIATLPFDKEFSVAPETLNGLCLRCQPEDPGMKCCPWEPDQPR